MRAWMTEIQKLIEQSKTHRPGQLYQSYEGLVLAEGREWSTARVDVRGPMKECFANAYFTATEEGWSYVEGWASWRGLPILHAWCLDGEEAVEVTWHEPAGSYIGLVLKIEEAAAAMARTGRWSVIGSDYLDGHRLLKEGVRA
jgi:hypothetical protein